MSMLDDVRITQSRPTRVAAPPAPRDGAAPGAASSLDSPADAGSPDGPAPLEGDARLAETGQALPSAAGLPPAAVAVAAAKAEALPPPPGGHAPLEGFDHVKLANLDHKTPKYLFARVAKQFGLEAVKDKAAGERLLQQMVPYMKAAGLEIAGVRGDKINVKTDLGWEWVDVIRGSGSGDPAWWWGSEGKGSPNPGTGVAAGGPGGLKPLPGGHAPLEGFDHAKINNPAHRSLKYLFARIAMQTGLESVKDMASAEALLKEMVPHMQAAGMEVVGVKNDKIQVKTEIGYEWVDVIRGAGGGDPAWQWGSEGKGTPTPAGGGGLPAPAPGGTPAPGPGGPAPGPAAPHPDTYGPPLPGGPLTTIPDNPEWAGAPIDTSSIDAAVKSAAEWVKVRHPEFFTAGEDRPTAYRMMTEVIGVLRAKGFDAHRVVNHPSRPVGDPGRYGKDALVLANTIFDVYKGWGDPGDGKPQALNVGPYGSRPRE